AKVQEELTELEQDWTDPDRREDEIGDVLFSVVNLARHAGCDPEQALRRASRKFERRFRDMETVCHAQQRRLEQCTAEELEAQWQAIKKMHDNSA
ncbi:MAG: MazG nucleotide pyrophosphohydrolase domain-containing protein, partial [Gammaproteobacteria bacterium]